MATKSGMNPVHPGEVLREELDELGASANALAKAIDVPTNRVTAILNGERGVTADTALRLGRYFDTTAQFWLNLQQAWQIRRAEIKAGSHIFERVIPRRTEALLGAARQAHSVSFQGASALRMIERNVAFCDQLCAAERSIGALALNRQSLRTLGGPLDELRRVGVLDTVFHRKLNLTRRWLTEYENRFRRPGASDLARLVAQLPPTRTASAIERLAATMKNPWLDVANELGSISRLVRLQEIGELVGRQSAFSKSVTAQVRDSLGDWRDTITWPDIIWRDLGARAEFYADLGFDPDLTDMPAPAFREATEVAEIRPEPPSLVESYGPPVPASSDIDQEVAFARTNQAHDWLQRLESQLRHFIDIKMTQAFGRNWPKHQLPNGKYNQWKDKKEAAARTRAPVRPLIAYADFTDYVLVITRKDNWRKLFKNHFERKEDVRESLQRLYPIRVDTMHARPISQDDELLLYVEVKRIMGGIAS